MQADIQFLAFFLATTHFKNQNSHTITKTWSTPETPYPCRMLHCFTHSFWRSKNLQEKQWKGPGPQQPTSEHRGSQTCLAAAERERGTRKDMNVKEVRERSNSPFSLQLTSSFPQPVPKQIWMVLVEWKRSDHSSLNPKAWNWVISGHSK